MKFYHHSVTKPRGFAETPAWINRVTMLDGERSAEIWIVYLPSYGMMYNVNFDCALWSQRGFLWNLRTGEFRMISRPVDIAEGGLK